MPIAVRRLKVRTENRDIDVEVRLFEPVDENGMWVCSYEIDWPTGTKKSSGAGVDGIQAIILALQKIGIELYTSSFHENGELIWEKPGRGYGFPVPNTVRDLLVADDRK